MLSVGFIMFNAPEFANAITMLPFAILTYYAKNDLQAVLISLMWIGSIMYHGMVSFGYEKLGHKYFVVDCVFQIASLLVLVFLSRCYATNKKTQEYAIYVGLGLLTMVMMLGTAGVEYYKSWILYITLTAHILHAVLGYFFVCDRRSYFKAVFALAIVGFLFVACENGCSYMWSVAHIILIFYIWYFWKALDMIDKNLFTNRET